MKYLKIYFTSFTVFLEILKIFLKKSSENDQSTGHFQRFIFFVSPTLNIPVNQLIKKSGLTIRL